ncbi:alkaline phosphatase, partial [Escherichia coli]|nr:alkaline phosphatase [Escherichia coli]
ERDRAIKPLDDVLAGSAWDLWVSFESASPKTADALKAFWQRQTTPKAILILDALSLREAPWILESAQQRGYTIHSAGATASE